MTIKNLTPHPINIFKDSGDVVVFQSSGLARIQSSTIPNGSFEGIKLTKTEFGKVEGLPEFQEGIFFIVSQLVKSALPTRSDLLVPSEVVRDDNGNIIGCRSLGV